MATITTNIYSGRSRRIDHPPDHPQPYARNGIFTTTITERNETSTSTPVIRIRALDYHIERLIGSAQERYRFSSEHRRTHPEHSAVGLKYELLRLVREYYTSTDSTCAKLRITLDELGVTVFQQEWNARWDSRNGIRLKTINLIRPSPEVKDADTTTSSHAAAEAQQQGFDEALLISPQGIVAEGSWSNFFWFDREGNLRTPKTLLLPGVTRRILLNHEPCIVCDAPLTKILSSAEEAFVTQATHGIAPVVSIDDSVIGEGQPGYGTRQVISRFSEYQKQYDTLVSLGV